MFMTTVMLDAIEKRLMLMVKLRGEKHLLLLNEHDVLRDNFRVAIFQRVIKNMNIYHDGNVPKIVNNIVRGFIMCTYENERNYA